MIKSYFSAVLGLLILVGIDAGWAQPASLASGNDEIQVLIDVSGSMKQHDPDNLRVEASRLLVNLLPDAYKVAVWLFAEKTMPLAATEAVSAKWKQQAMKDIGNIHSRGLYTNIEAALQTVVDRGFKGGGNKHLILLTDGFVDISKDIMESADSRERILSEWIPKLQQQHIKVQTVALSEQADKELLDKLALETGGWSEMALSAEQLQRLFSKMAQKAAPRDSVPLSDNRFMVDSGIREFSLLAFKKDKAAPSQLRMPDGKLLSKQSNQPNLSWLESQSYDLVTVKQPLAGEWRLEAVIDPDNQVMIVTNLKLEVAGMANFVGEHEAVTIKAHFNDGDQLITRADFLGMLSLSVVVDQQPAVPMPVVAGELGFFSYTLAQLPLGKHVVKVVADGKTFSREAVSELEVIAMPISIDKQVDAEKRQVSLLLKPDVSVLKSEGMVVSALISKPGQAAENREMTLKDGAWRLDLTDLPASQSTQVNFNISAKRLDGSMMTPVLKAVSIDDSWFAPKAELAEHQEKAEGESSNVESIDAKQEAAADTQEGSADASMVSEYSGWTLAAIVLGANFLVMGIAYLIYRLVQNAHAKRQQELLERLS